MKYLLLALLLFTTTALADTALTLLDKWQCGKFVCGIAADKDNNLYMTISDDKGLLFVYFRGKLVYERSGNDKPA